MPEAPLRHRRGQAVSPARRGASGPPIVGEAERDIEVWNAGNRNGWLRCSTMRARPSRSHREHDWRGLNSAVASPGLLPVFLIPSDPAPGPRTEGAKRTHDGISYLPIRQRRKTTAVAAVTAMMSAQVAVIRNAIHAAAMRPTKNPTTLSTFMG